MKKALIAALMTLSVSTFSQAQLFEKGPDILVCSVSQPTDADIWDQFVFYISGTQVDGSILYKSLTSNPVLITITPDGKVSAPNLGDCDGKNVKDLWEAGRAANFSRK